MWSAWRLCSASIYSESMAGETGPKTTPSTTWGDIFQLLVWFLCYHLMGSTEDLGKRKLLQELEALPPVRSVMLRISADLSGFWFEG